MKEKPIIDKRRIRLEDVMKRDYIPFLGGRPKRETIIDFDDILNLTISLSTTSSVEAFLNTI